MGINTRKSTKRGNKRNKKHWYNATLAVATAVLMAVSIINLNVVLADEEQTEPPYPYTIFAASKEDGAVYFDVVNCCINGSVATNGTISSTGNVNLSGLVYAPFGLVKISARNLTLNNVIIIADKIIIECDSINANYGNSVAKFVGYESEELGTEENSAEEGSEESSENSLIFNNLLNSYNERE